MAVHPEEPRTVLIALDEAEHSLYALRWAVRHLAHHAEDRVIVLSVHPQQDGANLGSVAPEVVGNLDSASDEASRILQETCASEATHEASCQVNVEAHVARGDARERILSWAERRGADVVVLGTRRLGQLGRAWVGSVSSRVAAEAPCSVLIVKKPPWQGPDEVHQPGARKILMGYDTSEGSFRACLWTLEHVCKAGDDVVIVNVQQPRFTLLPAVIPGIDAVRVGKSAVPTGDIIDGDGEEENATRASIQDLVKLAQDLQVHCEGRVVKGKDAGKQMVEEVEKERADLLVTASRGRGRMNRMLLGSVSSYCVHNSPSSVLVVRPNAQRPSILGREHRPHSVPVATGAGDDVAAERTELQAEALAGKAREDLPMRPPPPTPGEA
eukprot:SM000225S07011  [mRNA]  locus=s225:35601:38088:+ [translate_table: standard]